jgi:hypothetical protein
MKIDLVLPTLTHSIQSQVPQKKKMKLSQASRLPLRSQCLGFCARPYPLHTNIRSFAQVAHRRVLDVPKVITQSQITRLI